MGARIAWGLVAVVLALIAFSALRPTPPKDPENEQIRRTCRQAFPDSRDFEDACVVAEIQRRATLE